jgi:hypothetical protein
MVEQLDEAYWLPETNQHPPQLDRYNLINTIPLLPVFIKDGIMIAKFPSLTRPSHLALKSHN